MSTINHLPDLSDFKPSTCQDTKRIKGTGGLSIVYSGNGKRVAINQGMSEQLGHPTSLQIGMNDHILAIGESLGDTHTDYTLTEQGNYRIIYNSELVKDLIDYYALDFSNRTSRTFPILDVQDVDGSVVVYIDMAPTDDRTDQS